MLVVKSNEYCIFINMRSAIEVKVDSADVVAKEDVFKASNEILFCNLLKKLDFILLFVKIILLRSYLSPSSNVNFSHVHVFFR